MVNFDPATHTYINEKGIQLISVTQLMKVMGVAPDYGDIPDSILQKAAEYGTAIHKELEDYIKTGKLDCLSSSAPHDFASECVERGYEPRLSEYMVYDDIMAGTIDCVASHGGDYVLIDFKTTASLNKDVVAWQLSLYSYLWNKSHDESERITAIELWHFDKNNHNRLSVHPLAFKPDEEIARLINCYITKTEYHPLALFDSNLSLDALVSAEEVIAYYDSKLKEAKAQAESMRVALMDAMIKNSTHKFENDRISITLVDATEHITFDTARFKKDYPELHAEYNNKKSAVKASIRINLKENKNA